MATPNLVDNSLDPSFLTKIVGFYDAIVAKLEFVSPVAFLLLRIWVAWQFYKSGLTKLPIENAIFLFENEYTVPLLPPALAAYLATIVELGCSALLMVGLAGRVSALALFVLNIVALLSYEYATLKDHLPWGLVLLVFVLHGPGKLSIDYLIGRFVRRPS
ncbi:MAG: DoxX family protein [Gammaproteobacteria bacterium]|nr:DoxX family protein [Gammaproteobacteria bacterium]MCP5459430.1 DoxX family protein [Gammaproteobacteria bacterium]